MPQHRSLCAALFLAVAPSAAAQDQPPATPDRDVAVTYRMAAGPEREMRIAWHTATQRMRLDMPGQGYMIVDQREQRAFMVMDATRMIMEIPFAQNTQRMGQLPPGARLTREGQERIAGHDCTVWAYQEGDRTGRSCVTPDGVVLRVAGAAGPEESMEATAVAYGPQDRARFEPPAGYGALAMPAMGGMPPAAIAPGAGITPPAGMPFGAAPFGAAPGASSGASSGSSSFMMPHGAMPQRPR